MRAWFLAAFLVGACDANIDMRDAGRDASSAVDAPSLDAPVAHDAPMDTAATDVGARDAPPIDAGSPTDAGIDAWGTCSIVPQSGCSATEACRRSPRLEPPFVRPHDGPPACELAGLIGEGRSLPGGGCRVDGDDQCAAGLFCTPPGTCARYCDPAGAPCPDLDGSPMRCRTDVYATIPVCLP